MKKKIIIIISITIIIFMCAVCCINMNNKHNRQYLVLTEEHTADDGYFRHYETVRTILYGADKVEFNDTGREYLDSDINTAGNAMVIYVHDIKDFSDGYPDVKINAYFTMNGSKPVLIGEDINPTGYFIKPFSAIGSNISISDSGNAVAFCDGGALYLYKTGRKTEIYRSENIMGTAISPDGETVLFGVAEALDDPEKKCTCYVYQNDSIHKIDGDFFPLSVSDNGEVIYLWKSFNGAESYSEYYSVKNLNTITSLGRRKFFDYYFSVDRTQFMFASGVDEDTAYYVYKPETDEKIKVSDGRLTLCNSYYEETNLINPELVNFDDFAVYKNDKLYRFTLNESTYDIEEYHHNSSDATPALYHRRLLAEKTEILGQNSLYLDYGNDKIQICSDMLFLCGADTNCEIVYYVNMKNELVCFRNSELSVVDSNILYDTAKVTPDGVCVYVSNFDYNQNKGDLCFSDKGGEGELIRSCNGSVLKINVYGSCVAVETTDGVFTSNDGKNFSCIN